MTNETNGPTNSGPTQENDPEFIRGWYDATYRADYYFSLNEVGWCEAAVLLSGLDPRDHNDFVDASERLTGSPIPEQNQALIDLVRLFSKHQDRKQTLTGWIELARSAKTTTAPWIEEYLALPGVSPSTTPAVMPKEFIKYLAYLSGLFPNATAEEIRRKIVGFLKDQSSPERQMALEHFDLWGAHLTLVGKRVAIASSTWASYMTRAKRFLANSDSETARSTQKD